MKLDENQQKAVEHFEGPALVVAGPGSGKTEVIIERIVNLIRENGIKPYQILALAFNRKAMREMEQRFSLKLAALDVQSDYGKPEICTLHAFGRRIISNNHRKLNLMGMPNTWKAFRLKNTIKEEIAKLKREKANAEVIIYEISSRKTGRCYYIGQTTNLRIRQKEHLADSSNSHLRQAILAEGPESVKFTPIDKVEGRYADKRETEWIEYYRNRTVFNSHLEDKAPEREIIDAPVTIYKIESQGTERCYIGYTTNLEQTEQNFLDIPNNALQEAIRSEGEEQFTFEVLHEEVPVAEVPDRIADEIETHKNRAVFNQSNPLSQRY
ncbi:AAA family ATPase, partial [Candidatus Poribacteria bacterium]|nr:AAA family ATPase [Candidatus Poribacteria bacterium]